MGFTSSQETIRVQLADGATAKIPGTIHIPLRINGRTYRHRFLILPDLHNDVLIGVDLWARMGCVLSPPRCRGATRNPPACGVATSLTGRDPEEDEQLRRFLDVELPLFEQVTGPTPLIEHHIRLIKTTTIK